MRNRTDVRAGARASGSMEETTLDLDLVQPTIAAGDADAFGWFMAHAEPELRVSLTRFAAVVDTEAIVQETFLRVWQVAPRFEPDGRPNGLLRLAVRIAKNLSISELRRARTRPAEADELERRLEDERPSEVSPPDPHLRQVIERCRDQLPNKPAQALAARLDARGGEPDAVLADRLGMRKNTFLQNFTRARRLLRECLEGQGVDLEGELA